MHVNLSSDRSSLHNPFTDLPRIYVCRHGHRYEFYFVISPNFKPHVEWRDFVSDSGNGLTQYQQTIIMKRLFQIETTGIAV